MRFMFLTFSHGVFMRFMFLTFLHVRNHFSSLCPFLCFLKFAKTPASLHHPQKSRSRKISETKQQSNVIRNRVSLHGAVQRHTHLHTIFSEPHSFTCISRLFVWPMPQLPGQLYRPREMTIFFFFHCCKTPISCLHGTPMSSTFHSCIFVTFDGGLV